VAVSFDLFGTLVEADRPSDTAAAVADELADRGVRVPGDWQAAYREPHVDAEDGREIPLPVHVRAALASRGVECSRAVAREAVVAAFDADVQTRDGAVEAVEAAAAAGPVGMLSNCSVPGLADRALGRATVPEAVFDAVMVSVDAGWRKPHERAFEAVAGALGVEPADLVHVGDDPRTDGGIEDVGGTFVSVSRVPVSSVPDRLEVAGCR
jgi:FMN phosphatase YigB (HAD superfamily)